MLNIPNEVLPGQIITAADQSALLRLAKSHVPRRVPGSLIRTGSGGTTQYRILRPATKQWPLLSSAAVPWPFKGYNKTVNSGSTHTPQVQINGGDGSLASLSPTDGTASGIACIAGARTDTATGSPPVYPELPITGNGYVYVKAWLNSSGQVTPGASSGGTGVDVFFTTGSVPAPDSATPPTYGIKPLGTVTNFATDGSGNETFTYNDANGPVGLTTVSVCGNTVTIS